MTTATIVADSISPAGVRITTLQLRYPRFLLAQFNTHRVFSRSTRSSRAVPVEKMIAEVESYPVVPMEWGSNQRGMVAGPPLDVDAESLARRHWLAARDQAVSFARRMAENGVTKQIANRLLEPFMWAHTVVTSTEWENFFTLRLAHDAQPEMQALARAMMAAMDASEPVGREWHTPYVTDRERSTFRMSGVQMISAARCARVSYKPFGGSDPNVQADLDLAGRLIQDRHMSPFEHQGMALLDLNARSRNFRGWFQHRATIEG